jgi:hypothetical protein
MSTVGLFAAMDFAAVAPDEFNAWYDTEHIAERRGLPGFLTCERWVGVDNPTYSLGSYDLESIETLESPGYRAITGDNVTPWYRRVTSKCRRMFRLIGDQVYPNDALAPAGAGALLINALNIPPELEEDFARWSDESHLPSLAEVPGTLSARRFVVRNGTHRHIAVYHLASADVPAGAAWKAAAARGGSGRIVPQFQDRIRLLFRQATPTR